MVKKFYQNGNLLIHIKVHSGGKTYQCNQCEKPFAHVWDLVKHKRVHTAQWAGGGFDEFLNLMNFLVC